MDNNNRYQNNTPPNERSAYNTSMYYTPESHYRARKSENKNTALIIVAIVMGALCLLMVLLCVGLVGMNIINKSTDNDTTSQTSSVTQSQTSDTASSNTPSSNTTSPNTTQTNANADFFVRRSAGDVQSEVGAYTSYTEACETARNYKNSDYEVYDKYGNMLYTPEDPIKNPTSSQVKYRIRLGSYDSKTQIGAYANYTKALDAVRARSNEGYKIFDMNGNILYDPYTALR